MTPTSLGLLMVAAPENKRALYVKIWTASAALAAATGPVVGGLLVELSWRWIFLVNIPVGLSAIVAVVNVVVGTATAWVLDMRSTSVQTMERHGKCRR